MQTLAITLHLRIDDLLLAITIIVVGYDKPGTLVLFRRVPPFMYCAMGEVFQKRYKSPIGIKQRDLSLIPTKFVTAIQLWTK